MCINTLETLEEHGKEVLDPSLSRFHMKINTIKTSNLLGKVPYSTFTYCILDKSVFGVVFLEYLERCVIKGL